MDDSTFNLLFECLKILQDRLLKIPSHGKQDSYQASKHDNENETFDLIINRKGHLNDKYLTFQLNSRHGILIRLDMNGQPHENINGELVETPHVHIFDIAHDKGRMAVPLSALSDLELIENIEASLLFFLEHNNIQRPNITEELV